MKFTSSRRSVVALLLCEALLFRSIPAIAIAEEAGPPEPALLLKFAAPELPDSYARELLDPIPSIVARELRVRWLPVPREPSADRPSSVEIRVPDDAALRRIAAMVSRSSELMEKVESAAALRVLEEAEKECRSYRFTGATRPFLAEIFLRRGILNLWEGRTSDAEALFSRVRSLQPGFAPDPAIFPPQMLSVWEASGRRPAPEAELLVESLPSGASIFLDGVPRGVTPARVRTANTGVVRIRVSHPGYRDAERSGQWLPGDTESLRFSLPGDRVARLGELLAGAAKGMGAGAGPLVRELSMSAGTSRVAIMMIEREGAGSGIHARLFAGRPDGRDPVLLGEKSIPEGKEGPEVHGKWIADALAADGWPKTERPARPWYNSPWFWGGVLAATIVGVLGASGGGGGSGGAAGGAVSVNF